ILVTKATSQFSLGQEISAQVTAKPGPLALGAVILLGLALAPGLPTLPFLLLGGGLWVASRRKTAPATPSQPDGQATAAQRASVDIPLEEFLQVDRICVEIGARLIPLIESKNGPGLRE